MWIENDQSPSSNLKLQDIQAKNHHQANPVVVRSLAEHSAQVLEQPGRSVWNIYDARIHDAALFLRITVRRMPPGHQVSTHVVRIGRAFGPEQQLQGPWFAIQVTGAHPRRLGNRRPWPYFEVRRPPTFAQPVCVRVD